MTVILPLHKYISTDRVTPSPILSIQIKMVLPYWKGAAH